ncbi:hypothetical protein A2U01_0118555, partial [Trifolium medium]|nr:hypothetical protein [Trifolium medium]
FLYYATSLYWAATHPRA